MADLGEAFLGVAVIGSINLDLVASVERLPAAGRNRARLSFMTAPGGKGANQALAAARAGGRTRMIGAVGRDAFAGEALASHARAASTLPAFARPPRRPAPR